MFYTLLFSSFLHCVLPLCSSPPCPPPGEEAGVEEGQRRIFMSNGGCREGLSLQQGSQYLIMGPNQDLWSVDSATSR